MSVSIQDGPFDEGGELTAFSQGHEATGAVVTFTGRVRGNDQLKALYLEHFPGLCERSIEDIIVQARERWSINEVKVIHRIGELTPGEGIVLVLVSAAHRRAAFLACDFIMDYLKTTAYFWKKEIMKDGTSVWIEPPRRGLFGRAIMERDRARKISGMSGIDESMTFKPVRIAVLTVSDTRDASTDTSGDLLQARIEEAGHLVAERMIVKDDVALIKETVNSFIDDPEIDAVISTGGTGLTGRDVTVEAVRPLFEKEIDGFSVVFHMVSFESIGLSTLQSRACAGLARGTFIFALPGSNGAVKDGWDKVISYQLDARYRPCNLVEIMPRLLEV